MVKDIEVYIHDITLYFDDPKFDFIDGGLIIKTPHARHFFYTIEGKVIEIKQNVEDLSAQQLQCCI